MSNDDELLAKLWPRICEDKGWASDEETNAASRQRYIDDFASLRVVQFKGPRASTSRWCSLLTSMRQEDSHYHDKLLLMASLCCHKGWASSWEELFVRSPRLLHACGMQDEAQKVPRDVEWGASRPASSSASASSAVPPPAAQAAQSGSAQQGKKTKGRVSIGAIIKQSANMFHACTRIMADASLIQDNRFVLHCTGPLEKEHSRVASEVRDPAAMLAYYI